MANESRTQATYLLAFSIFCLAVALVYFTYEVALVRQQIPTILASVESASAKVDPLIKEIGEIRDLIPPVMAEVAETRKQIPPILDEVRLSRKQIPAILNEVDAISTQIPSIILEVSVIRQQIPDILAEMAAIRQQIPSVLESADKASAMVTAVAMEIANTRPLINQVLVEVDQIRNALPDILEQAEKVVKKAEEAGKNVSEGAVHGVITGIIRAPFSIVGNLRKHILALNDEQLKELNEKDMKLIEEASKKLLTAKEIHASQKWANKKSKVRGEASLIAIKQKNAKECRTLQIKVWNKNELKLDRKTELCKTDNGNWGKSN